MKTIFKNSMLVAALALMLVLPMLGFGAFDYTKQQQSVLGVKSEEDKNKTTVITGVKVVDQLDLRFSLSYEPLQKFYDVIPEEYLSDEFIEYIVAPKELISEGFHFEIAENDLSRDLIVKYTGSSFPAKPYVIDLPIIIIKSSI